MPQELPVIQTPRAKAPPPHYDFDAVLSARGVELAARRRA